MNVPRLSIKMTIAGACLAVIVLSACDRDAGLEPVDTSVPMFDGETLKGWHTVDESIWRVQDNAITGGSLVETVEHNSFLLSDDSFQNFDLTLQIRLTGTEGSINSGIQIRSVYVLNSHEVAGYQVDAGDDWWGKLYDESRRDRVLDVAANIDAVNNAVNRDDWNTYRILGEGRRIRSWINGVAALDYTEEDETIPQSGHIGIQIHGGGKAQVQIRDIRIKVLPYETGLPGWPNEN